MYKMTIKEKFKNSIRRGTGEAHLIMRANPKIDFSNYIIKAALNNFSYDNQSEGSRAVYIFELIELSNRKEKIREAVLRRLANERTDSWALDQLFGITALLAKNGDLQARKAIYKRFYKKRIKYSEWLGEDAIIAVDGIEGLKFIAEIKGKMIQRYPEERDDGFIVDFFQDNNPDINVYDELEKSAINRTYIKTYLNTILKYKNLRPGGKRQKYNYEIVSERINSNVMIPLPPADVKDLSESDIKKLASDFLNETDRLRQEKYMRIFDRIQYPYDYQSILEIAKGKYSNKDRLIEFSIKALRFFKSKDIRDFALEKISRAKYLDIYINLLIGNYKNGDSKLLHEIVQRTKNEHKIDDLAFSYVGIYTANKTKDCKVPLAALYDKLTCGIHRKDIVNILIENKVLPTKIMREIEHDSYEATRVLWLENN